MTLSLERTEELLFNLINSDNDMLPPSGWPYLEEEESGLTVYLPKYPKWSDHSEAEKSLFRKGLHLQSVFDAHLYPESAEELYNNWAEVQRRVGWKCGRKYDAEKKTDPALRFGFHSLDRRAQRRLCLVCAFMKTLNEWSKIDHPAWKGRKNDFQVYYP